MGKISNIIKLITLRFQTLPQIVIRSFMGNTEEALKYLDRGYYLSLTGYLCKVSIIIIILQIYFMK